MIQAAMRLVWMRAAAIWVAAPAWVSTWVLTWILLATDASAQPQRLSPADPQPKAEALQAGLAVRYAFPNSVKWLREAEGWRRYDPKPGTPLVGFDYPDSVPGEPVLTTNRPENVIAFIEGYIRFDTPGIWRIEFHSNDGLRVNIGGVEVYKHDGRHVCETLGWTEFEVPQAGWYPVQATYFQRLNTACLMMRWAEPGGKMRWTRTDVYGH
ncbi:MAG: hypothetical protein AAGC92_12715 [Pseudomonadota bacterium]